MWLEAAGWRRHSAAVSEVPKPDLLGILTERSGEDETQEGVEEGGAVM
jgi:hypothetical protein